MKNNRNFNHEGEQDGDDLAREHLDKITGYDDYRYNSKTDKFVLDNGVSFKKIGFESMYDKYFKTAQKEFDQKIKQNPELDNDEYSNGFFDGYQSYWNAWRELNDDSEDYEASNPDGFFDE